MARRKKGRSVHGWLVLDKPAGMTSTQAVGAVRRAFDARKAGPRRHPRSAGDRHPADRAGRSDQDGAVRRGRPEELPLHRALGRRNRHRRRGRPRRQDQRRASRSRRHRGACCRDFTGEIQQVPPAFSAIKIDGNRAYDLARSGEEVVLEARPVRRSTGWTWSTCRMPIRPCSRPIAARAPTCARWPATWAARSAVSATSSRCGARALPASPRPMR